jgi:hypothetical protein
MLINNVLQIVLIFLFIYYSSSIEQRYVNGIQFALSLMQTNFKEQQSFSIHSPNDISYITFNKTRLLKTKINNYAFTNVNNTLIELKNISFLFIVDAFTYLPILDKLDNQIELSYPSIFLEIRYDKINLYNNNNMSLSLGQFENFSNSTLFFSRNTRLTSINYFDYCFRNETVLNYILNKYHSIVFNKFSNWFNNYNLIYNDLIEIFKQTEKYFENLTVSIPLMYTNINKILYNKHYFYPETSKYINENNTLVVQTTFYITFQVLTEEALEPKFDYRIKLSEFNESSFNFHTELIWFDQQTQCFTEEESKKFFLETYRSNFSVFYSNYFKKYIQ